MKEGKSVSIGVKGLDFKSQVVFLEASPLGSLSRVVIALKKQFWKLAKKPVQVTFRSGESVQTTPDTFQSPNKASLPSCITFSGFSNLFLSMASL